MEETKQGAPLYAIPDKVRNDIFDLIDYPSGDDDDKMLLGIMAALYMPVVEGGANAQVAIALERIATAQEQIAGLLAGKDGNRAQVEASCSGVVYNHH